MFDFFFNHIGPEFWSDKEFFHKTSHVFLRDIGRLMREVLDAVLVWGVMTRETLGKSIRQFFGTVKKELKTKGKRAEGDPNKVANCQ